MSSPHAYSISIRPSQQCPTLSYCPTHQYYLHICICSIVISGVRQKNFNVNSIDLLSREFGLETVTVLSLYLVSQIDIYFVLFLTDVSLLYIYIWFNFF